MLDEIILAEQRRVGGDRISHAADQRDVRQNAHNELTDVSPSGRRRQNRLRRDRFLRDARHALRIVAKRKEKGRELSVSFDNTRKELVAPTARELSPSGGDTQLNGSLSEQQKAKHLLDLLPGIQSGRLAQLAQNLHLVAAKPPPRPSEENVILRP